MYIILYIGIIISVQQRSGKRGRLFSTSLETLEFRTFGKSSYRFCLIKATEIMRAAQANFFLIIYRIFKRLSHSLVQNFDGNKTGHAWLCKKYLVFARTSKKIRFLFDFFFCYLFVFMRNLANRISAHVMCAIYNMYYMYIYGVSDQAQN